MSLRAAAIACCLTSTLAACGPGGAAADWSDDERAAILRLEWTDAALRPSPTNRFADDERAARFGQRLFFDPSFSEHGTVSCATCHQPGLHFTDGKPVADVGIAGTVNTPTVVGAAFNTWLFWDGRKDSTWAQALGPIENPIEHGFSRVETVRALHAGHRTEFEALFGPLPPMDDTTRFPPRAMPQPGDPTAPDNVAWEAMALADREAVNVAFVNFAKSIEAYERRLVPQRAPFDDYAAAVRAETDSTALSADAIAGLRLFVGRAGCTNCHDGPRFTDDGFHNLAVPPSPGDEGRSLGRQRGALDVLADPFNCAGPYSDRRDACAELEHLDPAFPDFAGSFRTPSLRSVARTPPYMHNGTLATLDAVVRFYAELPGQAVVGHREMTLTPLTLTDDERRQLVAFLESLTGAPLPDALLKAP